MTIKAVEHKHDGSSSYSYRADGTIQGPLKRDVPEIRTLAQTTALRVRRAR
jgi:hypothetical protein